MVTEAATHAQTWGELIANVGFPIALFVMMSVTIGIVLWRCLPWLAVNVVTPVTAAHVKLVETLEKASNSQADAMEKQAEAMTKMAKSFEQLEQFMARHHALTESLEDRAERGEFCKSKEKNHRHEGTA